MSFFAQISCSEICKDWLIHVLQQLAIVNWRLPAELNLRKLGRFVWTTAELDTNDVILGHANAGTSNF